MEPRRPAINVWERQLMGDVEGIQREREAEGRQGTIALFPFAPTPQASLRAFSLRAVSESNSEPSGRIYTAML